MLKLGGFRISRCKAAPLASVESGHIVHHGMLLIIIILIIIIINTITIITIIAIIIIIVIKIRSEQLKNEHNLQKK